MLLLHQAAKVWSTVNRRWYKKSRTSVGSPFDHT